MGRVDLTNKWDREHSTISVRYPVWGYFSMTTPHPLLVLRKMLWGLPVLGFGNFTRLDFILETKAKNTFSYLRCQKSSCSRYSWKTPAQCLAGKNYWMNLCICRLWAPQIIMSSPKHRPVLSAGIQKCRGSQSYSHMEFSWEGDKHSKLTENIRS